MFLQRQTFLHQLSPPTNFSLIPCSYRNSFSQGNSYCFSLAMTRQKKPTSCSKNDQHKSSVLANMWNKMHIMGLCYFRRCAFNCTDSDQAFLKGTPQSFTFTTITLQNCLSSDKLTNSSSSYKKKRQQKKKII